MKSWLKRSLCLLLAAACVGMAGCRPSEAPPVPPARSPAPRPSSETEYTKEVQK